MTLTTYPLDEVDYLGADAALFHCTRTTGIYAGDDFSFSVTGADNIVTLQPGIAWMRISRFKGLVAAMKLETNVDVGLPDPVFPRIDRVVLQFDANKNDTEVVVKRGSASSNPNPPARSMTEAIYEIHLLEVRREPGAVAITAANITDLRLDPASCGLMADSVTSVDTSAIHNQVTALIDELRREIQGVQDGSEYLMRSGGTMTGDITMDGHRISGLSEPDGDSDAANKNYVDSKRFTATATISTAWTGASAPYSQDVAIPGMLATDNPHITPVYSSDNTTAIAQRESWSAINYAYAGDGIITFACFEDKPTTAIPIFVEVMR